MHYSSAKTNYGKPNLRLMTWNRLKPSNQKPPKLLCAFKLYDFTCKHAHIFTYV